MNVAFTREQLERLQSIAAGIQLETAQLVQALIEQKLDELELSLSKPQPQADHQPDMKVARKR